MSADRTQARGINDLLGDIARDGSVLLAREFALFRAELRANLSRMVAGLVAVAGAAVLAIVALVLLAQSAVEALARFVGDEALSGLIVATALLLIAALLAVFARAWLRFSAFSARRTRNALKRDASMLSKKVQRVMP